MELKKQSYSGTLNPSRTEWEWGHRMIAREAAKESMVLLKNDDGLLPLPCGKRLALYGGGAQRTIKGGTGSGDVNERDSISVREGFEFSDLVVASHSWLDEYERTYRQARLDWKEKLEKMDRENTDPSVGFFDIYAENAFEVPAGRMITEEDVREADTDTAMYVLSRVAGEGADRHAVKGDYYLTDIEEEQIAFLNGHFENVILVLNTGAQVDLSWLPKRKNVRSVILMGQAGMEGGTALANLVTGRCVPSGKLAMSWAYHYEDYPCSATFSHNDGNTQEELYEEGLYVGYRYFESFGIPVQFPFGYGLSYTDFKIDYLSFTFDEKKQMICLLTEVTNTGKVFSGKQVVQAYVSQPQTGMPKPLRILGGFAKTELLRPGQSQRLKVTIPIKTLASYDESRHAWVLEEGRYGIWAGDASDNLTLIGAADAAAECILEQCAPICPIQRDITELVRPDDLAEGFELGWHMMLDDERLPIRAIRGREEKTAVPPHEIPEHMAERLVASIPAKDLLPMLYGEISRGHDNATLVALGSAGIAVPGAAGETSSCLAERAGIPGMPMADGPAGLRLTQEYEVNHETGAIYPRTFLDSMEHGFFSRAEKHEGADVYYQYCTAIPVGSLLAQSFNTALIEKVGHMIGEEMDRFHIIWWLAPGMNIFRDPLCGRNFEYYSEDPVVSGLIAAAMTDGVQSVPGVGTTLKHFACNNQEDNRKTSNSILTERTLREIYLRGFEIAVRKSQPMCVMSSYNKINGVHNANNYDLCTQVLRNEWGFAGVVMTDWTTTDERGESIPHKCAMAGNDLIMPGAASDVKELNEALESGELTEEAVRACAARIIAIAYRSNCYENAVPYHRTQEL